MKEKGRMEKDDPSSEINNPECKTADLRRLSFLFLRLRVFRRSCKNMQEEPPSKSTELGHYKSNQNYQKHSHYFKKQQNIQAQILPDVQVASDWYQVVSPKADHVLDPESRPLARRFRPASEYLRGLHDFLFVRRIFNDLSLKNLNF